MAIVEILSYGVRWNVEHNNGTIGLNLANGVRWYIPVLTPEGMHMLIDLLRNEKPVSFDDETGDLVFPSTFGGPGPGEPVGENE